MTMDALIQGRLHGDAVQRATKTGKPYATARLAACDASGGPHLVSLIAFDAGVVRQLLALDDGAALAVAGELTVSTYTAKSGEIKPALRLTVHQVLTPHHVRRRRETVQAAAAGDAANRRDAEGTRRVRTPAGALRMLDTTRAMARLDPDEQALISIQGISRGNAALPDDDLCDLASDAL